MATDPRFVERIISTQEELDAAWVDGPPPPMPAVIVDYDPVWPGLFAREQRRLCDLLGDTVVAIEHVGSTSVPGLAAKPIVDIDLVVPDSSDEDAYLPRLVAAGYRLTVREPNWHEHRLFKGPDTNINLHVFSSGCPEVERMRRFRDRLRGDEADRLLYERTKRELARREWAHVQDYAKAKSAVVEEIIARAREDIGPRPDEGG